MTYADKWCGFHFFLQERTRPYTRYTTFPGSRNYTSTCQNPLSYHYPVIQHTQNKHICAKVSSYLTSHPYLRLEHTKWKHQSYFGQMSWTSGYQYNDLLYRWQLQSNPDLSVTTLTMPQLSSISVNKQLVKGTSAVCAIKIIFTKLPKRTIAKQTKLQSSFSQAAILWTTSYKTLNYQNWITIFETKGSKTYHMYLGIALVIHRMLVGSCFLA